MSKDKKEHLLCWIENAIYLIIWALLLMMPVYGAYRSGVKEIDWQFVGRIWLKTSPMIAVFAIHNYP